MENLKKEITGNWFDLKNVMEHQVELFDYFEFTHEQLEAVIMQIYEAVEEGILEYKQQIINSVFSLTDSLKYDTASLAKLDGLTSALKSLIFTVLIQRLISRKVIKLKSRNEEKTDDGNKEDQNFTVSDIGDIVKEVQALITKNPKVKTDKNIMNILIQVSRYRTENDSMKKLIKTIPSDKLDNLKANYSQNINKILSSLVTSYNIYLKENTEKEVPKFSNPLEQYDLSIISEVLKKQAEEISAIRSTLDYAARERYRTREILKTIDSRKEKIYKLLDEEKNKYYNLALSDHGSIELSRSLSLEITGILKRELENLQ